MEDRNTTAITTVKQDVQMQEWIAQVQEQKASGLTVQGWCAENGINCNRQYITHWVGSTGQKKVK